MWLKKEKVPKRKKFTTNTSFYFLLQSIGEYSYNGQDRQDTTLRIISIIVHLPFKFLDPVPLPSLIRLRRRLLRLSHSGLFRQSTLYHLICAFPPSCLPVRCIRLRRIGEGVWWKPPTWKRVWSPKGGWITCVAPVGAGLFFVTIDPGVYTPGYQLYRSLRTSGDCVLGDHRPRSLHSGLPVVSVLADLRRIIVLGDDRPRSFVVCTWNESRAHGKSLFRIIIPENCDM